MLGHKKKKIKLKWKDFQITWANILFTKEHREHKCLNREIIHLYPLNELISNLMPDIGLKKSWHRGKDLKKQSILTKYSWENI